MGISTWDKLISLPNPQLRFLIEMNPAEEYPIGTDWTSEGTNTYSHSCVEFLVNAVTDDGVELTSRTTIQLVKDNAGSYYFDYANQTLYVHCADDYDLNAGSAPYPLILVFVWKYFATDNCVFEGKQYKALVAQNSIPAIDLSVDDIVAGVYKFNFSSFGLMNVDQWFDINSEKYIWTSKKVLIKVGGEFLPYSEYQLYFLGRIADFEVDNEQILFTVTDIRSSTLGQIPIDHYWIADYPNLNPDSEGKPIPIFYGVKTDILPVCIDTTAGTGSKWKIAGSRTIKEITAVRKNGYALTETTHYTVDLNNAEITLLVSFHWDDGDTLEVDAKGFVDGSDVLIEKGGSIAKDILKTYLGCLDADLDSASFDDVDTNRNYNLCPYLDTDQSSKDVLQTIGRSVIAFLTPTENGKLSFILYKAETPVNTLNLVEQDFVEWKVIKDDSFVRNKVIVRYNMNPMTQVWSEVERNNDAVIPKYGVREPLVLETYHRQVADAENVCEAIRDMVSKPISVLDTTIGMKGFGLFPTRKIKVTRQRAADLTGSYSQKVFRLRSVTKDTTAENTRLVALDDLQSLGGVLCTDCYSCQVCVTQEADCTVCYPCQICVVSQGGCSLCDTCQLCDTTQSGCVDCDTCELCNTCQQSVGQCAVCQACYSCDSCYTCQGDVNTCSTCQVCNTCQVGVATCQTCQSCNTCQLSVTQCTICQVCVACQVCDTCEGSCQTCQNCVTAECGQW